LGGGGGREEKKPSAGNRIGASILEEANGEKNKRPLKGNSMPQGSNKVVQAESEKG